MLYPSIVVDDFFKDPDSIVNFASKLTYYKDEEGRWPGSRTKGLHENHQSFFDYVNAKILSIVYANDMNYCNDVKLQASTSFQKIPGERYPNTGWIHKDPEDITAIIYLSKHKGCGTSLCKKISFDEGILGQGELTDEKIKFYKKENYDSNEKKYLQSNNQNFKKTLTVDSEYNRLFLFDSHNWHCAESFNDENVKEDRLTLISFISYVYFDNKKVRYPIVESRRLD